MDYIPSDWTKLHKLTAIPLNSLPALYQCPWRPLDAHCAPASLYCHDEVECEAPRIQYPVWGKYYGDGDRKRFYAQYCSTNRPDIRRFFTLAFHRGSGIPSDGQGLFIGYVDIDTLNYPDKLYNPSTWWWAGYLPDLPQGGTYYYICADIEQQYPISTDLFLLIVTNSEYQNGWSAGGHDDPLYGGLPLWRFSHNEPGHPDGWEMMEYRWKVANRLYIGIGEGGALYWPNTTIEDPSFPRTAQEGQPYYFSFLQYNHNAFCSCAATGEPGGPCLLCWRLIDRDTGEPIGDPVVNELGCEYFAINWQNFQIVFGGGGYTFHGQLQAGHIEDSSCHIDDTYDFDVVVSDGQPECSEIYDKNECFAAGCYWYNNSCHDNPPSSCGILNNRTDCIYYGCYWWNGSCHTSSPTCEQINNQDDCEDYDCYWYDGGCHSDPKPCEEYTTQGECINHGCYWYNESCHTNPPDCEDYNNVVECFAAGCWWYNNSCHTDIPTCEIINNEEDCGQYGCYWYNDACHTNPAECEEYQTQSECIQHGCYWYDGSCHTDPPPVNCEEYLTKEECRVVGCHWYNGACHTDPPICEGIVNQEDCEYYGCYWYNDWCHAFPPPPCEEHMTKQECEAYGCYWYDNSCHTNPQIPIVPILFGAGVAAVAITTALIWRKR